MQSKVDSAVDALVDAQAATDRDPVLLFTAGKDSMILLDLARKHLDTIPHLGVIDTGNQFESIYDHREWVADEWGVELDTRRNDEFINAVIENPDDDRDYAWDGPKTEACCGALKIDVMGEFIADGYDPLIIGRRAADVNGPLPVAEEKREPSPHSRYHPLHDWSDAHVRAYIKKHQLPLPDVYDEGYEHTDCVDCVTTGEDGDDWSGVSPEKREQLDQLRDMGYM